MGQGRCRDRSHQRWTCRPVGSSGSAVLGVPAWSVSPLGLVCLLPEGAPVLLLALPLRLRVQNVISHPAVYFSVTAHLVFPFASSHLAPFPAWTRAACHCHMPGSSASGPPAPLGHERKLMPSVSLEPAATSLGADVASDLLSANNPRPGKAKGALGSVAPFQACGSR